MTEYELSDYAATLMGNFLTALTVYFSVITAYVIAAFVAGARLTKTQLLIVNSCFIVAAGIVGFLVVLIFNRFFAFAAQTPNPIGAAEPIDFTLPLAILVAGIFVGCLVFMWDVRKTGMTPNKSLHWPPGIPCHASCTVMMLASHEVR